MQQLKSDRISIPAVIALILALLTLPGVFCCAGFGTGIISIVLGIIGVIQCKNGEANEASKVMSWAAIVVSSLAMIGYSLYITLFVGASLLEPQMLDAVPK